MHSTLTELKTNISIRKMHWLAQGLRKVKFRWNQVSLWQHKILRETSFQLCIEKGKKYHTSLFLPVAYEREKKMSDTCSLFPPYGDPWPSYLLPSHLWPPDVKNWLIGKDPDAEKDWGWEEKGPTDDDMVVWHHWLYGHEFWVNSGS